MQVTALGASAPTVSGSSRQPSDGGTQIVAGHCTRYDAAMCRPAEYEDQWDSMGCL